MFGAPFFVIYWVALEFNAIRTVITKRKLSKRINHSCLKDRNYLFGDKTSNPYKIKFWLKILTSFGTRDNAWNYLDTFIKFKSIEASDVQEVIILLNKLSY